MTETVTHVAGPVVTICGRSIQRWRLVRVTSGNPTQYELVGEFGDALPEDFCIALVE